MQSVEKTGNTHKKLNNSVNQQQKERIIKVLCESSRGKRLHRGTEAPNHGRTDRGGVAQINTGDKG